MTRRDASALERFERYREAVSATFVPLEVAREAAGPFDADLSAQAGGDLQLAHVRASSIVVRRTQRLIARGGPECYKLGLQGAGTCDLPAGRA